MKNILPLNDEIEKFIENHPKGHFMQSELWGRVKSNWNRECIVSRDENGVINGALAVLIHKLPSLPFTLMYAPRGPVCDLDDQATIEFLLNGAKQLAKKHKAYALKIDPDVKVDNEHFLEIMRQCGCKQKKESKNFEGIQPRFVFRLSIEGKSETEIFEQFHSKTRYNIKLSVRKGVSVKLCGAEALDDFHRIMVETGSRDHFSIRPKSYFEKMLTALGDHARLYMAYFEDKPVAGTLAISYGDKVWYLYGASSNESRNVMPNYLLQWEMIKWAIESGARIYDFRGVSGDLSEDNPLYGLYKFKKGFSGEFCEFVSELDFVYNPFIYFAVDKIKFVLDKIKK